MPKHLVIINLESGKVANPKPLKTLLSSLKDGKYLVEIAAYNRRSNPQNRYYWGLVIPMVQEGIKQLGTDLTKEECHEFLKARFNSEELINEGTGEMIQIPRSTTSLSKSRFGEYIAKIQQFAAEFLGVVIPDPGVQTAIEYD